MTKLALILAVDTNLSTAPTDGEFLLLAIPMGDNPDNPEFVQWEIGQWVEENFQGYEHPARFDGPWRHVEDAYADREPIAWARFPDTPVELAALAREVVCKAAA